MTDRQLQRAINLIKKGVPTKEVEILTGLSPSLIAYALTVSVDNHDADHADEMHRNVCFGKVSTSPAENKNIFEEIADKNHDEDWNPPPPKQPTHSFPGTDKKLKVLASRAENGEALWHEEDFFDYEGFSEKIKRNQTGRKRTIEHLFFA